MEKVQREISSDKWKFPNFCDIMPGSAANLLLIRDINS